MTRLAIAIEAVRHEAAEVNEEDRVQTVLEARFEEVAALLSTLDMETLWEAAEDHERRVIIENMLESVTVFPDRLEVKVAGSPAIHVLYSEVGLKESENVQVGGDAGWWRDLNPHAPEGTSPSSWQRPTVARGKSTGHTVFLPVSIWVHFGLDATGVRSHRFSYRMSHDVSSSRRHV